MKKLVLLFFLVFFAIFIIESIPVFSFQRNPPSLTLISKDHSFLLSWSRPIYPCYYEIEILTDKNGISESPSIKKKYTLNNTLPLPSTPLPSSYRVTAHGLFKAISLPSSTITPPITIPGTSKPLSVTKYGKDNPTGRQPVLIWHLVPGAVYFELELTSEPPENPNEIDLSAHSLYSTREIFTNGYSADLRPYAYTKVYWRVRALDYEGNPVGVFSDAEEIYIDDALKTIPRPILNNIDKIENLPMPLYPVYKWIPMHRITNYEVEILNQPPEYENNTQPSQHQVWRKIADDSADCYDEVARLDPGTYYWRVRAIDPQGNTLGVYSDAERFIIEEPPTAIFAATFGDSITHGGGAVSYSPGNYEYSYQTYLDFPVLNLGRSGDTSTMTADRFDSDVLPFKPKNLLILCGSNSMRAGTPAETIIQDIITIRDKCETNNIRPIFLTLMPIHPDNIYRAFSSETADSWRKELSTVNAFIRKQAHVIDLEPYFYDENKFLATRYAIDGLHPDIEGKKLMADIINANKDRVLQY